MFKLKFETGNAAFTDNPHEETARILRDVAQKLDCGSEDGFVFDINGKKVGNWWLEL